MRKTTKEVVYEQQHKPMILETSIDEVCTKKPYDSNYKFIEGVNKNCDKFRENTLKANTTKNINIDILLPKTLTRLSTKDSTETVYNPISGNINNLLPKIEDKKNGCAIV